MRRTNPLNRRSMLKATGAIGAAALLAGCGEPEEEPGSEGQGGEEEGPGGDAGGEENGTDGGAGGEEEGQGGAGEDAWADVEEISLKGQVDGWVGVEPEPIADEQNPTFVLTAGQQYTVTWENADGQGHNFAILDDQDQVVEDYRTEVMDQQGETQDLEFEATEEMATYVCQPHQSSMNGQIEVSAGDGGGAGGEEEGAGGEEDGAGGGDNATDGGAGGGDNATDGGE